MKQDKALRRASRSWHMKDADRLPSNFTFRVMQRIQAEERRRERRRRRTEILVMCGATIFCLGMMVWQLGAQLKTMMFNVWAETHVGVVLLTSVAALFFCLLDAFLARKFRSRM